MKTEAVSTWPVSTGVAGRLALVGLPQRLGDGALPTRATYDRFPSLETIAGSDWLSQALGVLLPTDLAWAWWTPARNPGLAGLGRGVLPRVVVLASLDRVLGRTWHWRGQTLAILPPGASEAQSLVLEWAGIDTEQGPELLLTAPPQLANWDSESIRAWCVDRSAWRDPAAVARLPAERLVVLFDGDAYCALPAEGAPALHESLSRLAARWGLRVIPGPLGMAWPTPSPTGAAPVDSAG